MKQIMFKRYLFISGAALLGTALVFWCFMPKEKVAPEPHSSALSLVQNKIYWFQNALVFQDKNAIAPTSFATNFHLSQEVELALNNLQEFRKGRLHWPVLEGYNDADEKKTLQEIKTLLQASRDNFKFDNNEEDSRIKAIDYLGEKLIGRLPSENKEQIWDALEKHLFFDVLSTNFEQRKKQSLLGDQIEILQYLTRNDENKAMKIIDDVSPQARSHLKVGIENGLWFKGFSSEQIKNMMAQI